MVFLHFQFESCFRGWISSLSHRLIHFWCVVVCTPSNPGHCLKRLRPSPQAIEPFRSSPPNSYTFDPSSHLLIPPATLAHPCDSFWLWLFLLYLALPELNLSLSFFPPPLRPSTFATLSTCRRPPSTASYDTFALLRQPTSSASRRGRTQWLSRGLTPFCCVW